MARISLTCRCGWKFFFSDANPAPVVACPSCGEGVPIPGRAAPAAAGGGEQEEAKRKKMIILLGAIVAAIALIAVVILLMMGEESAPPRRDPLSAAPKSSSGGAPAVAPTPPPPPVEPRPIVTILEAAPPTPPPPKEAGPEGTPAPATATANPPPPATPKPPPEPEWRKIVDRSVPLINMAGVAAEVLRHQKNADGYDQVIARMNEHERRVREGLAKLAEKGTPYNIPGRMAAQDKILWFLGKDFTKLTSGESIALLQGWMKACQPGTLEKCTVQRASTQVELFLFFPDRNIEILGIMRMAGVVIEDPLLGPSTPLQVPEALVKSITDRFNAIHPGYRKFVPPEERDRMDTLLKSGRGFSDDVDFLRTRIAGDLLGRFEQEAAHCSDRVKELETGLLDTATDRILMNDGRSIEGKVKQENAETLTLVIGGGTAALNKSEIKEIQRGKGSASQFPDRFKAAKGKVEDLVTLMTWCKENRFLQRQKEYLACLVLTMDPLNDRARTELKLPRSFVQAPPAPPPK